MKQGINLFQPEFKFDNPQGNPKPKKHTTEGKPQQDSESKSNQADTSEKTPYKKSHKNQSHTKQKSTHSTT